MIDSVHLVVMAQLVRAASQPSLLSPSVGRGGLFATLTLQYVRPGTADLVALALQVGTETLYAFALLAMRVLGAKFNVTHVKVLSVVLEIVYLALAMITAAYAQLELVVVIVNSIQ